MRQELSYLRAGIILVPFGIVNILHDSDIRDTTQLPLYSKYIVPARWTDTGIGVHGTFNVSEAEVNYEIYAINGLAKKDFNEGLRNLRPQFNEDKNNTNAWSGRIGVSPFIGLEIGSNAYVGKYDDTNGITLLGFDAFGKKGPFEFIAEWAKAHIDIEPGSDLASGMNGYYIESRYHFFPSFLKNNIIAYGFDHPTFTLFARYGVIDLDENNTQIGKKTRITLGMNYRPTDTVVFKLEGQIQKQQSDIIRAETGIISSIAIGF